MSAPLNHTMLAVTFERYPTGYEPEKVPPHITLLPWFGDKINLGSEMRSIMQNAGPFTITQGEQAIIGVPGHEKQVVGVVSEGLMSLHKTLFNHFISRHVVFSDPQWLGDNYMPHFRQIPESDPFSTVNELLVSEIAVIRNHFNRHTKSGSKAISYERLGR